MDGGVSFTGQEGGALSPGAAPSDPRLRLSFGFTSPPPPKIHVHGRCCSCEEHQRPAGQRAQTYEELNDPAPSYQETTPPSGLLPVGSGQQQPCSATSVSAAEC